MTKLLTIPRILIVENERTIAVLMKLILAKEGYCVTDIVATGKEAVAIALNTQPDLILMEIKLMGKLDGIIAYEQIKITVDIPVIFMTTYAKKETIDRAMQSGARDFLAKPFKNSELTEKVNAALASYVNPGSGGQLVKKLNGQHFCRGDV